MNREYWIWLQTSLGPGSEIYSKIAYFGGVKELYDAGEKLWRKSGMFSVNQITRLKRFTINSKEVLKVVDECNRNNWHILTPDDENYPKLLKEISSFPAVLYVAGDLSFINDSVPLAVVGTRDASHYGYEAANRLSTALCKAGFTIVSGGALGIDSEAHSAALEAGGKTVAVLGSGLGINYPKANESLRDKVSRYGAVITELAPFTEPSRKTFPVRNRIISGMCLGTIVIEAGERSGSLITARLASEQGRDVFAVPGSITESSFIGGNRLIRDGAKPVFTAADVVEEYIKMFPEKLNMNDAEIPLTGEYSNRIYLPDKSGEEAVAKKVKKFFNVKEYEKSEELEKLSQGARQIYEVLKDGDFYADEITAKTKLPAKEVLAGLTELELSELVVLTSDKKYALFKYK